MGQHITGSPEERIERYRQMAEAARNDAYNSRIAWIAESYIALAHAWEAMAADLQHSEERKLHLLGETSGMEESAAAQFRPSTDSKSNT